MDDKNKKKQLRRILASEDPALAAYKAIEDMMEDVDEGTLTIKGKKGDPGRNPLVVSEEAPLNPQIGDLWYQP